MAKIIEAPNPCTTRQTITIIPDLESAISTDAIVKTNTPALLLAAARAIVEGNLERHYQDQLRQQKELPKDRENGKRLLERWRKDERELLLQLTRLKEWHNKRIEDER